MTLGATAAQLFSMFEFKGKPPPGQQSISEVNGLVRLLCDHCSGMTTLPGCESTLNEFDWQPALAKASSLMLDETSVKWFPAYGAALLAIGRSSVQGGPIVRRHLHIVGLDKGALKPYWVRPSIGPSKLSYGSVAGGASVVHAGIMEEKDRQSLFDNLQRAMETASNGHSLNRSTAFGRSGHQLTPSMIIDLLDDAKAALRSTITSEHIPAGGSTDVGLHTGTAWSLTREVFKVCLKRHAGGGTSECTRDLDQERLDVLFNLVVADLHLSLLEERLPSLSRKADDVNEGVEMLQRSARFGGHLAHAGHEMGKFMKRIETARQTLVNVAANQMTAVAERYRLPDINGLVTEDLRLPKVVLPSPLRPPSAAEGGIAVATARASKNLYGLAPMAAEGGLTPERLDDLVLWAARKDSAEGGLQSQLVIQEVEALLFGISAGQQIEAAAKTFGKSDTSKLVKLVERYRSALHAFMGASAGCSRMKVELWSRETLVVWIAYAVSYAVARCQEPQSMVNFGVCLNPDDLKCLVLPHKLAVDAGLKVADFLRSYTRDKLAVFTLADHGSATFSLAAKAATLSPRIRDLWQKEVEAAERRRDEHWSTVKAMQRQRTDIRGKLRVSKHALILQESQVEAAKQVSCSCSYRRYRRTCHPCAEVATAKSVCDMTRREIESFEKRLKETEKISPVFQPLPRGETAAYQVLFFLHMSDVFRSLSHLSFQAQQMLLPRRWDTALTMAVQRSPCSTLWSAYYNSNQSSKYHTVTASARRGLDGAVKLGIQSTLGKPETIVDNCTTPSDGVWHPDTLSPGCMLWEGGNFSPDKRSFPFDPFSPTIRPEWVADGYTEQLAVPDRSLQWAMPQYGIDRTTRDRGNLAMTTLNERPEWLRRWQYVEFGKVRAYPLTQCHQLALVLKDRSLPLGRPAVRALVLQALFQLGDLATGQRTTMLWRQNETDTFEALFHELKIRIAEIEHTPREYLAMQLLVTMAVYVGDWHVGCELLVRRSVVEIPRKWALDIDHQLEEATRAEDSAISSLKEKQCMCYMYGVLCFDGSALLSVDDISNLCELHVLVHKCCVYTEDNESEKEMSALRVRCLGIVAMRVRQIVQQAEVDPGFITVAVRRVLEHAPTELSWTPVAGMTACFKAEFEGHLFSINLLTGVVLYDGFPPSLLPGDIVKHRHYQRLFGEANFEVTMDSDGVFKTARAIHGRFYEFRPASGSPGACGDVVIEELDEGHGERLQLLQHDGAWSMELPVRLRTMHSHWLLREQETVVVRAKDFRERGVIFIIKCNLLDGLASCYHVPPHLRSHRVKEILKTVIDMGCDVGSKGKLVLLPEESKVLAVLSKFEPQATGPDAVIHTYLQPGGQLNIELTRFGLEFELARASARQKNGRGGSGIGCLSHRGYQLALAQQLDNTLPGLTRYLVIVREDGDTKILVPRGNVVVGENAISCAWVERDEKDQRRTPRVWITCDDDEREDAELKVFCYTMHRRWKQPDAGGISARLQLAAMFAATGSMLPDPLAGMTGSEKASDLVRRCFVNHPLHDSDRDRLLRVLHLSAENPALALLCGDLLESSTALVFLHNTDLVQEPPSRTSTSTLEHAECIYESECATLPWNLRRRLTIAEEERVLGGRVPMKTTTKSVEYGLIKLPRCPISVRQVDRAEANVNKRKKTVVSSTKKNGVRWSTSPAPVPPYPLTIPQDADTLTDDMHAELRSSWQAHQLAVPQPPHMPPAVIQRLHREFGCMRSEASMMRERLALYLLSALTDFGTGPHATASHMHRMAGLLPTASLADLPSLLWEKQRVHQFNPFLADVALSQLLKLVVVWLRLCVLDDKLGRLQLWTKTARAQPLMWQELDIENPGDIVQLNMGEGKTRVILPLLILHWAVPSHDAAVVRLHFLSSLIGEAYDFLHHALTGSLLRRRLFLMPFDRDVQLTLEGAQAMRGCVERCRNEGGAVLVAPEHRQSLYLKRLELRGTHSNVSSEIGRLEAMPFRDVYDESDELLHHRRQLIYAVGGLRKLPAQAERAHGVQALFRALKHRDKYPKLAGLLSDCNVAVEEVSKRPEQFDQLRLVPGQALDDVELELRRELLEVVLSDPPYEMLWVSAIDTKVRSQIFNLVLNEGVSAEQALDKVLLQEKTHWDQLMALRGLLAKGILVHCLQMRPRVQYGVSRAAGAKKRLAIPFRASNTPADRSEFKEPTLAITLTVLSYYYDGLSREQLREALATLLAGNMAESAQADYYNAWLAETEPPEGDMAKMDDVHKVDLTNEPQMEVLYTHFGRNFEVVNFWLNFVVFPGETQLCPSYIGTNSWFLASNSAGAVSGFSGTNDSHRLLPLQVRKNSEGSLPSLSGTNGKMLDLMMRNGHYITLDGAAPKRGEKGDGEGSEAWRMLLRLAVREDAHAVVDCGAVLGRMSSEDAAAFLLSSEGRLPERFRGVVFFDACRGTAAVGGEWMVRDRVGRSVALSGSPIQASEAFAVYDEARCRGADLKLSPNAKALLTIGPKNGKDKVMQAAGRLRLLGRSNQSVVFVGTADVSTKIKEVAGVSGHEKISSEHVLRYVMDNTVNATQSGLLQWARQGLHFSEVFDRADRAEQEEIMTLDAAYGAAYQQVTVASAAAMAVRRHKVRFGGDVHMPALAGRIGQRAKRYGKSVVVSRDVDIGGECEREMELEVEEEEEEERQTARVMPRAEVDWNYAAALSANSVGPLCHMAEAISLERAWKLLDAEAFIKCIRTSASMVFCTRNFVQTIETNGERGSHDEYLRPVDWGLAFTNGDVLLLSEREANGVLLARGGCSGRVASATLTPPTLIHLSYAGSAQRGPVLKRSIRVSSEITAQRDQALNTNSLMRDIMRDGGARIYAALAGIWVFGGITTIPKGGREAVQNVVKGGRVAVQYIVTCRDRGHMLPRSDLERLVS